jgi:hypothetical protein
MYNRDGRMSKYNGRIVTYQGHTYRIEKYHYGFEMFYAREVGRNFETLIPLEAVNGEKETREA